MTDRELLERAARAAGLTGEWASQRSLKRNSTSKDLVTGFWLRNPKGGYGKRWNPLEHDGDALRLAVKLGMQLDARDPATRVYGAPSGAIDQHHRGDRYAATRRAIVRAAAALAPQEYQP